MRKVLFVAAGPIEWGSSRMRCYWPARYIEGAKVVTFAEWMGWAHVQKRHIYEEYTAVIFQKNFDTEFVKEANTHVWGNSKTWLDVCDPSWWWSPAGVAEVVPHLRGVVCSSEALAADFIEWNKKYPYTSVHTIPDRLELSHFTHQRQHADVSPVRLIWFGVAVNRIALFGALANLERLAANGHKIELTIMDDRPEAVWNATDAFPVYHTRWQLDTEVEVLAAHDVVLLGEYPGSWGQVKSNNRLLTAWACGLPAVTGIDYRELVDIAGSTQRRAREGENGRNEVERAYHIEKSAAAWTALLGVSQW